MIRAKEFVPGFVTKIVGFHPQPVSVSFEIDDIAIGGDEAMPFALLLNELIVNCMKYAFIGRESGHILVELKQKGEQSTLVVADDGVGIKKNAKTGMGTRLVKAFVNQLRGSFHYSHSAAGTRFEAVLDLAGSRAASE
jgi:two-component sensor histidine kinase